MDSSTKNVDHDDHSEILSGKVKVGYAFGDFGANFFFQSVAIYLMFYFTDVFMISATAAGLIFFCSKIWDAISDPIMGYVTDHTETRWGQKRPYLLFGSIPLGITLFLLFAAPPISNYSLRIVYATITFIAVCTMYTVVNVPYAAMTANLTLDSRERSKLTSFRMMGAILGTLVVATLTKPFVSLFTDQAFGFRILGLTYGLAIAFFTLLTFFIVKERVRTHAQTHSGGIKDILKVTFRNKPLIFLFLGIFFHYTSFMVFLASVVYFFKYNLNRPGFVAVGFFFIYIPAAIMLPILAKIGRTYSKKVMFNGGMAIYGLGLLMLFFVHNFNMITLICIYTVIGLGTAAIYQGPWSTMPDTVEYSEWKLGLRRAGVIYGVFFFGMKLAAGFAAFLVGYILSMGGYFPDVVQTPTTLFTIRFLTTVLPIICFLIGAFFILLYPITHKRHIKMVKDIKRCNRCGDSSCIRDTKRRMECFQGIDG